MVDSQLAVAIGEDRGIRCGRRGKQVEPLTSAVEGLDRGADRRIGVVEGEHILNLLRAVDAAEGVDAGAVGGEAVDLRAAAQGQVIGPPLGQLAEYVEDHIRVGSKLLSAVVASVPIRFWALYSATWLGIMSWRASLSPPAPTKPCSSP